MAKKITRRDFIKIGVGATAVTTGFTPLVRQIVAEPFVKPPEEALPGRAIWYASTCRQCSAGCGILVRVINGRAKKIEGNPLHPLNRGKLCARGQAGLQVLYHPDRLRNAVQQTGGRGSRQFEPLHWENALQQALEKIRQAGPEGVAFLGGRMPDHLYFLVSRWLKAQGANPPVIHDLLSTLEGQATSIQVAETLFGSTRPPRYDLANADVIFSFGANFLETWCSPVAYSQAFGYFRQGQAKGRGYFVQFEPRLSATAASADEWIPVRPGTEGLVALALGLGHVGAFDKEEASLFQNVNVNQIAELSDISPDKLSHLANILAAADRPLAIPGGYPAGHTNGYDAYRAIFALNLILKRLGQRGGVFLSPSSPTEKLPASPPPNTFSDLQALIDKMHLGQVKMLMIYGCNPVFELPKSSGFLKALSKVPFVISFNSFVDETGLQSDLVLPDHTYLESWGYQVVTPGADRPTLSSQQPVVRPLYDTRSTADVILQLASMMGGEIAEELPWASEQLFLEDTSGVLYNLSIGA
jgi:anaerobic selenocysteine-containing dehydrogenase